jgi:hypothetical protein
LIYEFPEIEAPIRQGDIFFRVPRMDFSLKQLPIITDAGVIEETKWIEIVKGVELVTAMIAVRPVCAIVAKQDCDNTHGRDITLCEIRSFRDVERISKDTTSPGSWVKILTQHARINQKWFYLPPDPRVGFSEKMAVDFMVTLRLPREDLEDLRNLRVGRLIDIADEHFRERISEFFRRYPYDEWYPLSKEEFEFYKRRYPDAEPFPWQLEQS